MTTPSHDDIEKALAQGDAKRIAAFLDAGLDAAWKDGAGDTLLHHAARLGDETLIGRLLSSGAKAFSHNDALETPWDVAVIWSNDAAAKKLEIPTALGKKAAAAEKIPYAALEDIRKASDAAGESVLFALVKKGRFAQVAALAEKDAEGFSAQDFLARGPSGDTVILALCQQGDLPILMQPALWARKPQEFQNLWPSVPAVYRKGADFEGFMNSLRQTRLQSYGKPRLPGLKP